MRQVDWSKVPEHIVKKTAYQAVEAFCETHRPLEAQSYTWHWAPFHKNVVRVRLPAPVLKQKLEGGSVWIRTVIITPGWEMTGGAAERDRPTTPLRMTVRVGWDETHRVAVLFFANGGELQLEREALWLTAKR